MKILQKRVRIAAKLAGARGRRVRRPGFDWLEGRPLMATVTVNATQVVRTVDTQLLGVNLVEWDSDLNTTQTQQMVEAAGLTSFRFPGGSASDDFHFNAPPAYNGQGTATTIASFISSVNGVGMATLDYGSGSPQEAAAFLAYMNGSPSNTTVLGTGQEWNDSTNQWQTVNWQTAGYWASLRASAPLATDDGLNFLRIDHPASMNIHYWEVGNEEYGSWEVDHHTVQHDPATYVTFAKQFQTLANQIDPTISLGIDAGGPDAYSNWVGNVLQQSVSQGLTVGFISDHNYVQEPGSESDSTLLLDTVSSTAGQDPSDPYDWALRASDYETLLTQDLGATAAAKVELLATEYNSVSYDPGKQTTSLVNGLFVADSIGSLLETPYDGADVWDLRNYYDNSNNNSSSLYGWRTSGDYGLIGSPGNAAPGSGTYVPYPTYFAEQLASKIVQGGGKVVQASSSDPNLATYSVLEPNGHLDILVINKSSTATETGQFSLTGFQPSSSATTWQYGETQDTAQSQTTDGHSALANFTTSLSVSGSSFSDSFPAYSMTVLDLAPAPAGPSFVNQASATPSPVTGTTTVLSALATDPAGASSLTYTWATTGTPPAAVTFNPNGTNAAQSSTATFAKAGSYTFHVTVEDQAGLTAISVVTVLVNQTSTSLVINPGSITIQANGTESFSAVVDDQFAVPMTTQPTLSWSLASGVGTIGASTGVYSAPDAAGSAVVKATSGGISGTATVTISAPSSTGNTASFGGTDTTTQGTWSPTYGSAGYEVLGGATSLPSYATITTSSPAPFLWSGNTADVRAPQIAPGSSTRIPATWYGNTFTVDVNLTDGQAHNVSLYLLDWDKEGRSEQIQVIDPTTGTVLSTQVASSFQGGEYLTWSVTGHVQFKFTVLAGYNAVLSGIFIANTATQSSSNTASFGGTDTTTQGTWSPTYGSAGYEVLGGATSLPSYATITTSSPAPFLWSGNTADVRAPQIAPGSSTRIPATWYGNTFTVDVNLTDGQAHNVSLYLLDWDKEGRSEQIQVIDPTTGTVLSTQVASSFQGGEYLTWSVTGHVQFKFTVLAGYNAVLSGLFISR